MSRRVRSSLFVAIAVNLSPVAADAQTQPCAETDDPQAIVCAIKYGQKQSYWNACLAAQDGAYAITPGECPRKSGTNN